MKNNKTMKAASALLALTMITSSFVGGTFAKYVTSDSSEDQARVAKFGVVLAAADNSSFETEYKTDDSEYNGALSVKSSSTDKVVAPGTGTEENEAESITFTISGTPEVATKVDIEMEVTKDIYVKAGDHLDWTTSGDVEDKFTLNEDYYPVVFTLKQNGESVASGNLETIKNAVETYATTAYYAPNTNLEAEFELSWEWAFDDGQGTNDKADTLLGNVIAGVDTDTNVSTEIDYEITFTVTQVD